MLELLQLKYFQVVAHTEHLSQAAQQLNIAQPSLSLTIKRLENELGVSLFERNGRHIQLNAAGKAFLQHVNRILLELENAKLAVQTIQKEEFNTVKITLSNPRFLTNLISDFITTYPTIHLQQGIALKREIVMSLRKGEIDLGIAGPPIQDAEIESHLLMDEDIVLALPAHHPLIAREKVALHEIASEPFLTLANNEEYSDYVTKLCEGAGFTPKIRFEVDTQLLKEVIKLNQAVALLPISACRMGNLHYVQIADAAYTYPIGLSWHKNKMPTPAIEMLRNFIIDYYERNKVFYKL